MPARRPLSSSDLGPITDRILLARRSAPAGRALLVAVSGIDGSGKGYLTERIVASIAQAGLKVAGLGIDPWLNLPQVRFSQVRPAEHFYRHALRFGELFERLVLPLKAERSVRVEADYAEETAVAFRRHTWEVSDVDVIVLEGIYLLKSELRPHYDLALWVECSFETALVRALRRAQEGLSFDETVRAYRTIYFPAQLIHFAVDDPQSAAHEVVENDPRLRRGGEW